MPAGTFKRTAKTQGAKRSIHKLSFPATLVALAAAAAMLFSTFFLVNTSKNDTGANKRQAPAHSFTSNPTAPAPTRTTEQAREAYGQLPLSFEANHGQAGESVNFVARGAGYTLALSPTAAVFRLRNDNQQAAINKQQSAIEESVISNRQSQTQHSALSTQDSKNQQSAVLRMNLVGANAAATVAGQNELEGRVNYFLGNDPAKWRTDVPTFGRVRYTEVYPGIDVVYYGNQRRLEYDFVVAPGRDARAIALEFAGAEKVEVDEATGDLLVHVGEETIRQHAPVTYQETASGGRREVENHYVMRDGGQVGFEVGEYDASAPLVIDPVLQYSSYLGGSGGDFGLNIAVDSAGNAYVVGETDSTNFPTVNPIQGTLGGDSDAFVTKINAAGSGLVYSTYFGGNALDLAEGITVDSAGNAYVIGDTESTNFPTVNPIQGTNGGSKDGFVMKINAAGTAIVYSTYLGGNSVEFGSNIAVDSAGNAYVTGGTASSNFPTVNPIDGTYGGFVFDAFVAKINAAGSALVYSTYLGGDGGTDVGYGIAVDSAGNAYVTGIGQTGFPTVNPFQGTGSTTDAFVTKINAAGSALVYSSRLGGNRSERGRAIALDSSGNAYVTGETDSTNFPTVNPIDGTFDGSLAVTDIFVTKVNAAGSALVYSTYLGTGGFDSGSAVAVDSAGNAYIAGGTTSCFPTTTGAFDTTANGGGSDAFVTKISETAPPSTLTPIVSTVQFAQANYTVTEDVTFVTVTVTRTGDTSAPAAVDYATSDGAASELSDYTTALGTLRFAAGETSKTIDLLVNEDRFVEGTETFAVALSNPTVGACLGVPSTAIIQITDDASEPSTNVIDDPGTFIGTHYHDFLNRQADASGQAFWTAQITACGSDAACIDARRTSVSQAFFLSIEYQQTGYLVFRFYKETFTDSVGRPRGMPRYREFLRDTQEIGRGVVVGVGNWEAQLETNKQDFAQRWVQKAEFIAEFPGTMTAAQFVDTLFLNSEVTTVPAAERSAAITAFGAGDVAGRAAALRNVADSGSVYNRQYNPAVVLIQYIGYLRRNPNETPDTNYGGFDFWLNKMNQFSIAGEDVRNEQVALGRIQRAEMVRAFIISIEYRGRFGP